MYQWKINNVFDRFDAGIVRPDGTPRPSFDVLTLNASLAGARGMARCTLTARISGKVEHERFETLDEALDALERRGSRCRGGRTPTRSAAADAALRARASR